MLLSGIQNQYLLMIVLWGIFGVVFVCVYKVRFILVKVRQKFINLKQFLLFQYVNYQRYLMIIQDFQKILKYLKYVFKVKMNQVFFIQVFLIKYFFCFRFNFSMFLFFRGISIEKVRERVLGKISMWDKERILFFFGFQLVYFYCLNNILLIRYVFNYFFKIREYI